MSQPVRKKRLKGSNGFSKRERSLVTLKKTVSMKQWKQKQTVEE